MKSVSIFHKEVYKAKYSLCMNQTSWEMKIFNLLPILHALRYSGGCTKNALSKCYSTLVTMITAAACSRPGA